MSPTKPRRRPPFERSSRTVAQKSSYALGIVCERKLVRATSGRRPRDYTPILGSKPSGPLPDRLAQIAQWIGFAFLKFSIPRGGLEALRLNGMIAHRAHSLCLTISAAPGKGLRHARKRKGQSDRSNDHSVGRSSARDRLRHLGFLFNSRQSQLVGTVACRRILALFGSGRAYRGAVPGTYSAAWRRGSAPLSSAWPKSSIRSSTSSRPTDNLIRPGAIPSAARCSGLSR
jgi:hypothetical protein